MSQPDDPYDLARFVKAQEYLYAQALAEIRRGRKQSHWMWFVFPQLDGLGSSAMAKRYAIRHAGEARAYLAHPVLGARLRECVDALLAIDGPSAAEIFGYPDDMKLRSSATLFDAISPGAAFHRLLEKYYPAGPDPVTLALLERADAGPT